MVDILGIPVYDEPLSRAVDDIVSTCTSTESIRANRLISLTGAHGLVHAQHDPLFAATLQEFTLNLPDGLPSVWVGKFLKRAVRMEQIRGSDFFREVMTRTSSHPIRHYLCGGKKGVADQLRVVCSRRFANDSVVGTFCPPFRAMSEDEWDVLAQDIGKSGADIVWIGLSTPKQEAFARNLARRIKVHYIATIGAAFDFHIGTVREAPVLFRRSGLEWFYRLCSDPKRLARRYAEIVPLFVLYNALDALGFKASRRRRGEGPN